MATFRILNVCLIIFLTEIKFYVFSGNAFTAVFKCVNVHMVINSKQATAKMWFY